MKQYELHLPKAVYSGRDSVEKLKEIAAGHKTAALFTDRGVRDSGLTERIEAILKETVRSVAVLDGLPVEPSYGKAQETVDLFRKTGADLIVAAGGGSVMDIAKLASIAAAGTYSIRDMLDNPLIGKKQVTSVLIPTTAGTGSEATMNSIVAVPEKGIKTGIVNPEMLADYVILDGEMIKGLPKKIAAATGLDALCHAIECYTSNKANPFSNLFAMESLKLIFSCIERACTDSGAMEEKNAMLLAAFYGGAAIAASGTTAVHALSYPLGGAYHIPHGVSNAMLLLPVMRFNKEACLKEFGEIYDTLEGCGLLKAGITDAGEKADLVLLRLEEIVRFLEIPARLKEFGVRESELESLVEAGMDVKRLLVNNKRKVTPEDARRLYREIL